MHFIPIGPKYLMYWFQAKKINNEAGRYFVFITRFAKGKSSVFLFYNSKMKIEFFLFSIKLINATVTASDIQVMWQLVPKNQYIYFFGLNVLFFLLFIRERDFCFTFTY